MGIDARTRKFRRSYKQITLATHKHPGLYFLLASVCQAHVNVGQYGVGKAVRLLGDKRIVISSL